MKTLLDDGNPTHENSIRYYATKVMETPAFYTKTSFMIGGVLPRNIFGVRGKTKEEVYAILDISSDVYQAK